jgi:hypothetical protein
MQLDNAIDTLHQNICVTKTVIRISLVLFIVVVKLEICTYACKCKADCYI